MITRTQPSSAVLSVFAVVFQISRDVQRKYSNLIPLLLLSAKAIVVKGINNEMLINNFFQFIKMCVYESLGQRQSTRVESCNNTDWPSTLEGTNSTYSDGKLYGLEMDIQAGYHMFMPLNTSYDNVSNQRFVLRSVRLDNATRCCALSSLR